MINQRLLVLGWHNVEGSWCFPSPPGSGTRGIQRQFRALKRYANVVPLGWALRELTMGRPLPRRSVAITFDDGYRDTLEIAARMLERLELPATVFLVPGILSGDVNPWWERLGWAFAKGGAGQVEWEGERLPLANSRSRLGAFKLVSERLKRRDRRQRERSTDELVSLLAPRGTYRADDLFLDWDGARALCRTMAIGSHSMHHAILAEESPEVQREDLAESRRRLQEELAVEADLFAYPNGAAGDFGPATVAAAELAGYSYSVTTQGGVNRPDTPPHEIRRWVVYPERGVAGLGVIPRDLVKAGLGR
ncbi:MAG: polysaccharide deacetylase family protein [Egibacteraceae bacterium]